MIRYTLKCDKGHGFDSWFADAAAYDGLATAGQLACPICGSAAIDKALMAPALQAKKKSGLTAGAASPDADTASSAARDSAAPPAPAAAPQPAAPQLAALEAAISDLRRHVEANSEYVGMNFATEARKMHEGDAPGRAIYGEARPEEARKLLEEGIPVAPLPFMPLRKVN